MAEFAKRHMPDELIKSAEYKAGKYEQALTNVFLKIDEMLQTEEGRSEISKLNKEFQAQSTESPSKRGFDEEDEGPEMKGCTSNVILIKDKIMYIANAGDSRSVLATKGVLSS